MSKYDYYDDDTDFEPEEFDNEDGDEISNLDQLWEFSDWDDSDLQEYEFHGTGDTGGS